MIHNAALDDAAPDFVRPVHPPLLRFFVDAFSYAAHPSEALRRRLAVAPYAGIGRADARALCVAAGERGGLAETIAARRVPLADGGLAARSFLDALDSVVSAYRAQGTTAADLLVTIARAFAFSAQSDRETWTFERLERCAAAFDAARPAGELWTAQAFIATLPVPTPVNARAAGGSPDIAALQPFAPLEREKSRNVVRRRGHLSASALGMFAQCERKWYYRYVCSAVEDPGSSASFYGTAFHLALERFHQEFVRADAAPRETLAARLEGWIVTAFESYRGKFETSIEFELQRRRAKRTAARYVDWFVRRSQARPFEVVGTETSVTLELDGYPFVGYVDRLDRDDADGSVTVVDYKTGTIPESAEEYRAKVAALVDFQLPLYYWARKAAGDDVKRLALVPLKEAQRDVQPVELEVVPGPAPRQRGDSPTGTIGIDELERARARMIELAHYLGEATIERFAVTPDPDACRYCTYANACRERPGRSEERFGR